MGSADEMVEHLDTAVALGYVSQDACRPYIEEYTILAKQLYKLIHNWRTL
jgi:four helix bundle protein